MSKKILTVFGSTGNQGGGLIKTVLNTPKLSQTYALRGVTRDVSKPKAKDLEAKGVEMVTADLNDASSVLTAIQGSAAVFGVTNFWETASAETEFNQGKNMVDACKSAGVELFIWSSLPNTTKLTGGRLKVPHFDSKAKVEDYATSSGVPASFMMPGFFMSNLPSSIKKSPDGNQLFEPWTTETRVPLLDAANDVGKFVGAMLLSGKTVHGKRIPAATGYYSPKQIAEAIEAATGTKTDFVPITDDQFKANLPPAAADELLANFQLIKDPGYYGPDGPSMLKEALSLFEGTGIEPPTKPEDFFRAALK